MMTLLEITFYDKININLKKGDASMDVIKSNEIDLSSLQKLRIQGTQSTLYTDGNICYKFLDGLYPNEKKDLHKKFLDMNGIKIDNVLLPQTLIIENGLLKGYTMTYFHNSMPLSDKFLKRYFNCNELLIYVEKASRILRDIHNNDIGCQDLSFENILVDNNGNIQFCDIDGCTFKKHHSPFFSILFKEFLIDYRNSKVSTVEDVDKISMILSFYLTLYGEVLQKITKKQYHTLLDHMNTLENMKKITSILIDKKGPIQDIPYLDEVIDLNDDYEIDRKKILTLKQRVFRRF